ncbi:MAG: 2-oxoglutarate dehydrogenase [Firmicutes bacterium]|nr:2-oxoglutarate dehydrogenase [Bacillota bacterium]
MFGFRSDGKRIKTIDPIMKLSPHVMTKRNDAMVMTLYDINCKGIDEYIFEKRKEENIRFNYMHVLIAGMVRTMALRPKLNRFIMDGRVYKRNEIQIAFAVKKALLDTVEETTIKLTFDGTENIYEIKEMMDKEIEINTKQTAFNETDSLAKFLTVVPNFLIKFVVGLLKWWDKIGILPKSVLQLSPFHTSLFFTNMKSIKMNYVFHHIYNFGTTSIFLSMGKEKYEPVILDRDEGTIGFEKNLKAGMVIDERICDGLYFGNSFREFIKFMDNPKKLETKLEHKVEDIK